MRRIKILLIALLAFVLLTSCAGQQKDGEKSEENNPVTVAQEATATPVPTPKYIPIPREHDSANDAIKFPDLDWYASYEEVVQAITGKYNQRDIIVFPSLRTEYSDTVASFPIELFSKRPEENVLGEIEGQQVEQMRLLFVNDPAVPLDETKNGDLYLYGVRYDFKQITPETADALNEWLTGLYGEGKNGHLATDQQMQKIYTDVNGNEAEVYYTGPWEMKTGSGTEQFDGTMYLQFRCGDAMAYLNEAK